LGRDRDRGRNGASDVIFDGLNGSKLKLERELDGARATDLVLGVEAAALAAPACLRGMAELRRSHAVDGRSKVGVVCSEKRSLSLNILCKVKSAWEALKSRRALGRGLPGLRRRCQRHLD